MNAAAGKHTSGFREALPWH